MDQSAFNPCKGLSALSLDGTELHERKYLPSRNRVAAGSAKACLAAAPRLAGSVDPVHEAEASEAVARPYNARRIDQSSTSFGVHSIDSRLPAGGLLQGSLNEFKLATLNDASVGLGLALALAARVKPKTMPILLVFAGRAPYEHELPYGPGVGSYGLDPQRALVVTAARFSDALWTMEEALNSGAVAAVIGVFDTTQRSIGLIPARRLVLAANKGKALGLIVTGAGDATLNVAHSRWRVSSLPSKPHFFDSQAPGAWRCRLWLERCRHGPSDLTWRLERRGTMEQALFALPDVQVTARAVSFAIHAPKKPHMNKPSETIALSA